MRRTCVRELSREVRALFAADEGTEAARNACAGGASLSAAAITAAAYADNPLSGVPAMVRCLQVFRAGPSEVERWLHAPRHEREATGGARLEVSVEPRASAPDQSHPVDTAAEQLLHQCGCRHRSRRLRAYVTHTPVATRVNPAGLAALVFADHEVPHDLAERCFLSWRITPALAAAQQVRGMGLDRFPFLRDCLVYDGPRPSVEPLDLEALLQRLELPS